MTELVEEKVEEKVEVDYEKLKGNNSQTWMEKPTSPFRTDLKERKSIDFFDYLAERATQILKQIFEWVWPLVLFGFFSTITLIGVLIFAEGLTFVPTNIVLAWVYAIMGGVTAILCGFCSLALLAVELIRFYYVFTAYIRRLKVQIRK